MRLACAINDNSHKILTMAAIDGAQRPDRARNAGSALESSDPDNG
jgi:hypothetical protein